MLKIPQVTDNFDGQIIAIDQSIKSAATDFKFEYTIDAPLFGDLYKLPNLVYMLIEHYTKRGFLCEYDGDDGSLKIRWDYPNMSWLEQKEITRSIPTMIPNLGSWFKACLLYLCMTNGTDIREYSNLTLQQELDKSIKEAATLGATETQFGFPSVPAPVIQNLFRDTFNLLEQNGFIILYDANTNFFICRWGTDIDISIFSGESITATVSVVI